MVDAGVEEGPTEFLFDVEALARMDEAGVFRHVRTRVDLLGGRLIRMAPIGSGHILAQSNLLFRLSTLIRDIGVHEALRAASGTLTVSPRDAPQPDGMVVPAATDRFYFDAAEARLVCEVSWSSLREDLGEMKALYARAGIAEYWVLDVKARELHLFREPQDGDYRLRRLYKPGDRISPLFAAGRGEIAVADLFA